MWVLRVMTIPFIDDKLLLDIELFDDGSKTMRTLTPLFGGTEMIGRRLVGA